MFFPPIEELATTDIISVPVQASLKEALQQMALRKVRNIIVKEESGGFGLLTATDLVRLRFTLPNMEIAVGDVEYQPLPCIVKDKNILDVLEQFDGSRGYAAVVDTSGSLYGIVSNTDILSSLDPQLMLQRQYLRDLLHRHEVKKMPHSTRLSEVLILLDEPDDAVIVTNQGKGVGIVTTHDAINILQRNISLSDPVHLHMSTPLHTVTYDLTVGEAVATLREKHFKRLVVEDSSNGEIIGIITQKDLIGVAYSRWVDLIRHHALEMREIINILERKAERLEQIAATDPLTGAANRARFEELLHAEQHRHNRAPDTPFSFIMFDIDRFKLINDTWGHNEGDLVLKGIVNGVRKYLRTTDILGRWGGEEFSVLLPQTDLQEAQLVAEKIRKSLAKTEFGRAGSITASFGVAESQAGEPIMDLIGRADDALYRAKQQGRNRVAV